jgi:hypothetical protein
MKAQKRQSFGKSVMCGFLLVAPVTSLLYAGPIVKGGEPPRAVSHVHTIQNPHQAENYRRLAAAKRKAAENVPAKRDCYLAWARYYDCLAGKYQTGDNRDCGKEPPAC